MKDENLKDNGLEEKKDSQNLEEKEDAIEEESVDNTITEPTAEDVVEVAKEKKSFGGIFSFLVKKKKTGNLDLLETNLIKDEVEVVYNWKKDLSIFFVLLLVVMIFIAESYIFLYNWKKQKEVENSYYLETEITATKSQINALKDQYDQAVEFKKRLEISSVVLSNHVYWTNFFNFLEKNTLRNNIYYKSFSGDPYGIYLLPAVSNDVLAVNFQSKVFSDNTDVNSVSVGEEEIINDETSGKTHINFNFNFNLDPKIFTN